MANYDDQHNERDSARSLPENEYDLNDEALSTPEDAYALSDAPEHSPPGDMFKSPVPEQAGQHAMAGKNAQQALSSHQLATAPAPSPADVSSGIRRALPLWHRARINRYVAQKRGERRALRRKSAARLLTLMAIAFTALFVLFSGTFGVSYAYYEAQLPQLNGIANHTKFQTTRIYDRNGKLLYQINDPKYGRRTYINYTDFAKNLVDATVAAEDHTFWTNSGVDLEGIVRAALANYQSQGVVEGASTITQQLIKRQLFLNQPRTVQTKMQEAILAYGISQQLPKWKIMEMYLNVIFYGEMNYGAEAAAQDFFGLQPKCTHEHCIPAVAQLDLAQASMLAGLPQLPSYYDPINNKPAALARQKMVLDSMVQLHMVTPQQARQAEQEMAKFNFKPYVDPSMIQAPHFVRYLIDEILVPMLGAQALYEGGFNIYTTLDVDLEKKVEQITYDRLYKDPCSQYLGCQGPLSQSHNVHNASVVVMDPSNGEILAMNGSANYHDKNPKVKGQFNSAVDALRQPGSSIKPVIYASAFEMGWYPAMIIPDHETIYPTKDPQSPSGYYTPQNYDQQFHSSFPMTVRNAIANSYNIPAVDTIEYVGLQNVLNMAGRLGLSTIANQPLSKLGPSLALGSKEVSLLSLTGAYATFANQGVRVPPVSILEITNNQGQIVYKYDASHPHGVRAVSPEIAFLINSVLSDNKARYHEFGPGNPLEVDRPAAAKTGTSNSFVDNWTMGYTPHVAVGVWVGNSDNSEMDNGVIGITGAGPIWHDVMEYVSNRYHYPADDFIKPDDVHEGTVSALTGMVPSPGEPTVTDWFIDGTMPTIHGQYTPPQCLGRHCRPRGNSDINGDGTPDGNDFDNQNGFDNQGGSDNPPGPDSNSPTPGPTP
ncbi:MAG TPA: transglycosylase domain-containing protein [Ktedonobacteraceae bacterium]|nr:transglycosylase domain-containing protein [Ktedonobacteraceae bacterium]